MTALTPRSTSVGPLAARLGSQPVIPWAAGLAVSGLAAAALILAVLNEVTIRAALSEFFVVAISAGLSFGAVGIVVALRRPDLRIGWLLCAVALAAAIPPFTAQYARYAVVTHPGGLPAGRLAAWLTVWDWPVGDALMVVGVALLFPDVRALGRRGRLVAWLAAAAAALMMGGNAVSPRANQALPEVSNPYGVAGAAGVGLAGQAIGTLMLLAAMIGALALLAGRYRRGSELQRQQVRWFLLAFAVLVVAEVLVPVIGFAVTRQASDPTVLGWAEAAAVPWLAAAIGVAVLRHGLYDIDLLINRTLVYVTMSGLVAGGYVLVVGYLGAQLDVHGTWVALVATGLVAVAFHPVRERVQRGVNRLLYGRRDEPYAVLTELGRRLEATLSPDSVLATIAVSVREALRVPYAAVTLYGARGAKAAAESGTPGPIAVRLPLAFGPENVGELAVAARQPGEQLSAADHRLLADFARHAGAAAHAVRLTTDLHAARERLVTAREEERRRLRRDLHDGLGPHLASLALTLDAARGLLRRDPAAAETVLVGLREQTQQAVADIRRIVNDLRPPALDDRGLIAALREHAARYAHTGLQVIIDAPGQLPPLSAAVDLAAYRIAAEAVTNTARHARAGHCSVSLTADAVTGLIRLEIVDDGCGLPASYRPGTGQSSMKARASELGGRCSIDSEPGAGTRVIARLPFAMDAT
jgi:signal transduction histidine kinase